MHYDPIKRQLGNFFNHSPFLRKLFYRLLDLLLLRAWHVKKALRAFQKNNPVSGIQILDAGSGFGQYCYRLSRLFPAAKILGVDVKQEQMDDCNLFFQKIGKREFVSFEVADLTQYKNVNRYHLILSVDVMEHILEDEQVFENFSQSLQPGGMLLISTPSDQGGSDTDHHEVEVSYTYGKFGSIAWKLSMKYPILLLGVSRIFYLILPFYYLVLFPCCALLNYLDINQYNKSGTGLLVKAIK